MSSLCHSGGWTCRGHQQSRPHLIPLHQSAPDPSAKENLKSSCSEFRTCQAVQAESAKNKLWIPCKWDYFGFLYSQMPFLFVCLFVSGCSSHQLF